MLKQCREWLIYICSNAVFLEIPPKQSSIIDSLAKENEVILSCTV